MKSSYTFEYNSELEKILDEALEGIALDVKADAAYAYLDYLVLGGGYGRGEGGILKTSEGARPFNDLDFFVISKTDAPEETAKLNKFFEKLSKKWTENLGIEVDFGAARSANYICKRSHILMWKEMIDCAKVVLGDAAKFKQVFTSNKFVPPREAARLMMNRTTGLVLAKQRLAKQSLDSFDIDFISRNINKSVLASADIVLLSSGFLPFKSLDRLEKISSMALPKELLGLKEAYLEALEFKKFPHTNYTKEELLLLHKNALKLAKNIFAVYSKYLESARGLSFLRRLKEVKTAYALRSSFALLGVKKAIFRSPLLSLICAAFNLLDKEKISESDLDIYVKIWKAIN